MHRYDLLKNNNNNVGISWVEATHRVGGRQNGMSK